MGGFASGMNREGFVLRWASDSDAAACATFHHRFPDVPVLERDVADLSVAVDQLEPVDVLTAGFRARASRKPATVGASTIRVAGRSSKSSASLVSSRR